MRLPPPRPLVSYTIFLSSADDAAALRVRVKRLVEESFNPQLLEAQSQFTIRLDMWERSAAQRPPPGKTSNDIFVERALNSDVLLVLLLDRLGTGTQEEIEAVLETDEVQLSILHFTERSDSRIRRMKVGRFIEQHRDRFFYLRRQCAPDSDESWIEIVKQLFAIVLGGVSRPDAEEPLVESR
jgi:hypothetical protein